MDIVQLGLCRDMAPVAMRERVAFSAQQVLETLVPFARELDLDEVVLLSTCNRTEIYAVTDDPAAARRSMAEHLCRSRGIGLDRTLADLFEWRCGSEAALHLFRVAAGLESQILGEGQILAQVREAARLAQVAGTCGPLLDTLFRHAVAAGKRVRTETDISRGAVSVGSAAVELVRRELGDLAGRTVMLIGAGKIGETTLRSLAAQAVGRILVANRTVEAAAELAGAVGGEAIGIAGMGEALRDSDVVLCCTGAPHYVLTRPDFEAIGERGLRPLVVVDVSVPRNVDPLARGVPGVRLYDIDDLEAVAGGHRASRASLVPAAETLLAQELSRFEAARSASAAARTIASLHHKVECLRDQEVERFRERSGRHFSAEQLELIEEFARSLARKFLHEPSVGLRAGSGGQQERDLSAVRHLFKLPAESRPSGRTGQRRRTAPLA